MKKTIKIPVWGARILCESFEEARYYSGNIQKIKVRGLKTFYQIQKERRERLAEQYSDPITRTCVAQTGMTPSEYQKLNHMAWND